MYALLGHFVTELRTIGLPVSVTEQIDAASALDAIDLTRRDAVRAALQATLVKHAEHLNAFTTAFDIMFSGRARPVDPGSHLLAGLDEQELRLLAGGAAADGERILLRALAGELVDRHAHIEPERRVAGRGYLANVLSAIRFTDLADDLDDAKSFDDNPLLRRLRRDRAQRDVGLLRDALEVEIRSQLVRDRGSAELARMNRIVLPESVDFGNASQRELDEIQDLVAPLARVLAVRSGQRRAGRQRGPLDFRRTIRLAASTAGVPITLRHRPRTPPRPHLVVLADVSGSVASFSRFTLILVDALRKTLPHTRTFAFIDNLVEVTDVFTGHSDTDAVWMQIRSHPSLVRLDGRSDYGSVLQLFAQHVLPQLGSRSTLLILGDARNNFQDPGAPALAEVSRRIGQVVWLNPEARRNWDTGDSVISVYAPYCSEVHECRSLFQLRDVVDRLSA